MESIVSQVDWTTIIGAVLGAAITLILGLVAYSRIPKKDMGAAALATVQAADKAMDMQAESYTQKIEDLESRVSRLETLLLEKDEKILRLEVQMEKERLDSNAAIQRHMRWINVLVEQIAKMGGIPVTLEEIEHLDSFRNRGQV